MNEAVAAIFATPKPQYEVETVCSCAAIYMNRFFVALLVVAGFVVVSPTVQAKGVTSGPITTLAPPAPDEPVWKIPNEGTISVNVFCLAGKPAFGFWPADVNCSPYLEVKKEIQPLSPVNSLDDYFHRRLRDLDTRFPYKVQVGNEEGLNVHDMVIRLLQAPAPIITLDGRHFLLDGFSQAVTAKYQPRQDAEDAAVNKERVRVKAMGVIIFIGLLVSLLVLVRVYRAARRRLPSVRWVKERAEEKLRTAVSGLIGKAQELREHRIISDETVREQTRKRLADSSHDERAALRIAITKALDEGNTDAAKALLAILQKMEGDTGTKGVSAP